MSKREIEVKILEIDVDKVINKILKIGAVEVYSTKISADFFINKEGKKLRLRRMNGENILTYKEKYDGGNVLITDETEIKFDNFDKMVALITALGFSKYGSSEKNRTSYKFEEIYFEIDTIPGIPTFLEIEAANVEELIKGVELLGYSMEDTCTLTERPLKERYGLA